MLYQKAEDGIQIVVLFHVVVKPVWRLNGRNYGLVMTYGHTQHAPKDSEIRIIIHERGRNVRAWVEFIEVPQQWVRCTFPTLSH